MASPDEQTAEQEDASIFETRPADDALVHGLRWRDERDDALSRLTALQERVEELEGERFTDGELHVLYCAMAGNHPESLADHRVPALRKLAKLSRSSRAALSTGGQHGE